MNDRKAHYDRAYGIWSGNPKGHKPDFTKCAANVIPRGGWSVASDHQCTRPCGHGPDGAFCKQHAKQYQLNA